jgi:capsular exopolysaccharide synthesis family protein
MTLFSVSFWEFRARRIDTAEEVVQGLGLRIVGALPALSGRGRHRPVAAQERRLHSLLVESIDATRAMVLHATRSESIRVVMITSALKGEGKTSLSCHLATSLARGGCKTLLVDGDLRSPSVHRVFGLLTPGPGLSELLRGEAIAEEVIQPTPAGELHLVTAGRTDAAATQALAHDGLRTFFDAMRARYDFIIVDSAPILPVADSLLVGQAADAVLFSILRDVSRLPKVYAAHERLAQLGVRILGGVVAGARAEFYGNVHQYEPQADA